MFRLILWLFLFSATSAGACAEIKTYPEIITFSGKAFSWPMEKRSEFKEGMPVRSWDPVSALDEQTLQEADCTKWSTSYKGATWCFSVEKNLLKFEKATKNGQSNRYEPLLGGRCVLGTSWGVPAATGDPRTFRVLEIDGTARLVLQSHNKWWNQYMRDEKLNLTLAKFAHRLYENTGVIRHYETPIKKAASKQ